MSRPSLGAAAVAWALSATILSAGSVAAREVSLFPKAASRWLVRPPAGEDLITATRTPDGTVLRVIFDAKSLFLVRDESRDESRKESRKELPVRHITLPYIDGSGVVQYATSEGDGSTEIRWLDGEGQLLVREKFELGLRPLVALAADGSSVFAGSGEAPAHSTLGRGEEASSLPRQAVAFSPTGTVAWRRPIPPDRAVILAAIASRGERSVVVTADRAQPLTENRIEVFASNGEPRGAAKLDATAQKLVLLPELPLVWVQTLRGHALFDVGAAEPRLRWQQAERRCAGSPHAAVADARARYLFLIDRECDGSYPFRWRLSVLDLAGGAVLQSSALDAGWEALGSAGDKEPIVPSLADWILVGRDEVSAVVGAYFYTWTWRATP